MSATAHEAMFSLSKNKTRGKVAMTDLHIDERAGVILVIAAFVVSVGMFLTPSSFWISIDHLDILDGPTWQDVRVDYDREIHRDFTGQWRVQAFRVEDGQITQSVCSTGWRTHEYSAGAILPELKTLNWFVQDPSCYQVGPGTYEVTVFWEINPDSLLGMRTIRLTDTFTITGQTS